jgi:hypothetical protein
MSKSCKHQDLLKNRLCKINYCAKCGSVNLMLGAMTLHLTFEQFEQLSQSLSQAVENKNKLEHPQESQHTSLATVVH